MIKNRQKFFQSVERKLIKAPEENIRRAMTRSAILVETTAVMSILRGNKSGSIVQKYNPKRTHQQSAAYEAPASDTGYLASNISHQVKKEPAGRGVPVIIGSVTASAEYAIHLEFGTQNMQPRPFLQPALVQSKDKIRQYFISEGIIT